jgi:catechol 2,3-dioxygenase-like lactoylglutathione lyase family enzyme
MVADVPANLTIVTLGVSDLGRSAAFYRGLGWEQRGDLVDGITWFRTSGSWLGIFGYDALAEDAGLPATPAEDLPAYRGSTLAISVGSPGAVDAAFAHAESVGARIVKAARPTPWGGYSGYFADPDGHLWEIAHAPGFPLDAQGRIDIGG